MDVIIGVFPYVLLLVVSGWLAVVAFNRRAVPGAYGMGAIFLIMAFSMLAFIFELLSPDLNAKVFWDTVQYLCLIVIPVVLVGFIMEYTGRRITRPWQTFGGIVVLPLTATLLIITNNFTENLRPDARLVPGSPFSLYTYSFGIQDYFCQFYFALYILISAGVLYNFSRKQPPALRRQTMVLIIGILIPLVGGALTLLGVSFEGIRDLTPISYTLCCLTVTWGLFRSSLLKTIPIARDVVFEKTKDAVLAVDRRNQVVDYNPSALDVFHVVPENVIGTPIASLVGPCLPPEGGNIQAEFQFEMTHHGEAGETFFRVSSIPLFEYHRQFTGRLLIFHDITESKLAQQVLLKNRGVLEQQVLARTAELAAANQELQAEITVRQQAESAKEVYSRELEALYQMSIDLADIPLERNLGEYLAIKLKNMTGAFLTAFIEYLPEKKEFATSYLAADSGVMQEIVYASKLDISRASFPVSDESYQEMINNPLIYKNSLSEIEFNVLPADKADAVKSMFRIEKFIYMTIHDQENILAVMFLAIQKGRPEPSEKILLAFSHLASITFRKRKAEAARRESELRFRELTNLLPQPVYECDLTGRITFANRKAYEMFGITTDEVDQEINLLDFVVEEQRGQMSDVLKRLSSNADAPGREYLSRRKDGATFPGLVYTSVVERDQKVVGLRGVTVDISAQKEAEEVLRASEEKFRAMVEQMAEGFLLVDSDGKVRFINTALEKILGITRAEIIGRPFWVYQTRLLTPERRTPEHIARLKSISSEMIENHSVEYFYRPIEAAIQSPDGSRHIIQQIVFPINTQKEHMIGSIIRDVTTEKTSQQSLERFARRMELLHHIDQSILMAQEPEEIARATLEEIGKLFPIFYSSIFLVDSLTQNIHLLAEGGEHPERNCPFTRELDLIDRLLSEDVNHIPDVCQSPLTSGLCETCSFSGGHSLLSFRLKYGDQRVGALHLCSSALNAFDPEHLEIGREIADQLAIAIRQTELFDQTRQSLEREKNLNRVTHSISSSFDLESTIPVFLRLTTELLGVDGASLTLLSEDESQLIFPEIYTYPAAIGRTRVQPGQGLAWKVVTTRLSIVVEDYARFPNALPEWVKAGVRAIAAVPVMAGNRVLGSLGVFRFSLTPTFTQRDVELVQAIAQQAGMAIHNSQMYNTVQATAEELSTAYNATIQGWSRALELRDKETQGHSERVIELSVKLASQMGMTREAMPHFLRGVFLHDIGKMGIPDSILLKPGPLTPDEWVIMRQHPEYARRLLSDIPYLRPALDVPYSHHEKWDGSGYPRGLKGEEIPLGARIFAVVDVWDALTSDRPYRPAWSEKATKDYLLENAGKHFDPQVVNVFLQLIHDESSNT